MNYYGRINANDIQTQHSISVKKIIDKSIVSYVIGIERNAFNYVNGISKTSPISFDKTLKMRNCRAGR